MATHPTRPSDKLEIDEETKRILDERMEAGDEHATDAKEFIASLQEKLRNKQPAPR